jgi:hypothetical protein
MAEQTVVTQTTTTSMVVTPTPTISWETKEYEEKERGRDWHWYVGLIAVLAAVIAFFVHNIFFGIFLLIAGVVVIIYAKKSPEHLKIVINPDGVSINDSLIPYKDVRQWWVDEMGNQDKLLLLVRSNFVPLISLPLDGVRAIDVRAALAGHAPEVEMHESTSVKIFDRLGF